MLVLSPSFRQSAELFRKVRGLWEGLGDAAPPAVQESAQSLELANGARVVCLPGKEGTVRGFSGVDLLIVDEAARVSDELYYAIRPMLAVSGGSLMMMSTPFGKRGVFFEEWENGTGWERYTVTAEEVPRISPEILEEERMSLGEWWFLQEYMCRFMDTVDQVFASEVVERAVTDEVKPLFIGGR